MVNKVLLIGNLVADPDVKALPTGMYVARMRLATNTYAGKDDEGKAKERTEFHYLVAFGKTAEFAGQYLKKGRTVYVDGRLQTSSWDDTTSGQKRYRTEVVVEEIKFVGHRPQEARALDPGPPGGRRSRSQPERGARLVRPPGRHAPGRLDQGAPGRAGQSRRSSQ